MSERCFVFVKRLGSSEDEESYAKLFFLAAEVEDVADIAQLACNTFRSWNAEYAGQVKLYLAQSIGQDEPTPEAEKAALDNRLQVSWSLERVGVRKGSFIIAVVTPQPPVPSQGNIRLLRPAVVARTPLAPCSFYLVPPVSIPP